MKKLLPVLIPLVKWSGVVVAAVAQFSIFLPSNFVIHGVLVSTIASALKDTALRIGDRIDDGKPNKSFRG